MQTHLDYNEMNRRNPKLKQELCSSSKTQRFDTKFVWFGEEMSEIWKKKKREIAFGEKETVSLKLTASSAIVNGGVTDG